MTDMPHAEVIGDPITQSKSPLIHGHWLKAAGIDGRYGRTRVSEADLPAFLAGRRADPAWRGCNVTMPLKAAVLDHVEDRGNVRGTIGAANLVLREADGTLIATNTDAGGFVEPIADLDLAGRTVTVAGAGGAARAVLFALKQLGVGKVAIVNRSPLKAAALLATFGLKGRVLGVDAAIPPSALVVNASAMGMADQPAWIPDLAGQDEGTVVYDLVYHPLETPLLLAAAEVGLATVDGLDMLVGQARIAFELLFGVAPPDSEDEAVRQLLLR